MFRVLTVVGGSLLALLAMGLYLWVRGYQAGVADTEERWTNAVGRSGRPH